MPYADITTLLEQLASPAEATCHAAGEALLKFRDASIPGLVQILSTGAPSARKAAAFLLGKLPHTDESKHALTEALTDSEPKVRKNAAISLAAFEDVNTAPKLIAAFQKEQISWVRISQILALGKIGGDLVTKLLDTYSPWDVTEAEALRKARDRCITPRHTLHWNERITISEPIILDVPIGLENVASEELHARAFPDLEKVHDGKLRLTGPIQPRRILGEARCIYRWMFHLATLPPFAKLLHKKEMLAQALDTSSVFARLREWLVGETTSLRYRFALTGKRIRKVEYLDILALVRNGLTKWGLQDSPSKYSFELNMHCYHDCSELWFAPAFEQDLRFAYRLGDVGASINPVVAACLARLVRTPHPEVIFDPTCGSGTLLIERLILGGTNTIVGMDISPTAIKVAKRNAATLAAANDIQFRVGDAIDPKNWMRIDEAVINLPFGLRTASLDRDLESLYGGIARNVVRFLNPHGQAIVYTANGKLWERSLGAMNLKAADVRTKPTLRVTSGGISVFIFRLARGGPKPDPHQNGR